MICRGQSVGIPHIDVFWRESLGWGDCLPVSLQDGAEDAGQFFGRILDEHTEVGKHLEDLHAKEITTFFATHPEQLFKPGDGVLQNL